MNFNDLRKIDVSEHIEKKNNLSYLSWAYAVDELLQKDPAATWEYRFFTYDSGLVPYCRIGESCMVFCTVTMFGKGMTAQLPVMDHRNKAIQNPDAFQVNTAMQRCLAKAISLHGIGLYIYAGEDLPEQDKPDPVAIKEAMMTGIRKSSNESEVRDHFKDFVRKLGVLPKTPDYEWAASLCKKRVSELNESVAVAA